MVFPRLFRSFHSLAAAALAICVSACTAAAQTPPAPAAAAHTFSIGQEDFLLDGQPYVIRCGEIHFPRVPREYWLHRLKMAHAMGLNAVCVYLFWNYHEWEEGKFDWEGQKDAAEFCRMAQKEGLWVILRPGPYSCAEWEMGGLPWWLLKRDGIQLRTSDPKFMEPATRYLKEVGRVLAPLQVTNGGPILMVQVENEYGSYGKDAAYMGALRQTMVDAGFNVPLFACNPPSDIGNGYRPDLFQVVNFGSGPDKAFEKLKQFQKTGPLMNGEFYPGWFDAWGRAHHQGDTAQYLADLKNMLDHRHSFSIYMAHGGTTFGLWSGADRPFSPDTSSYDYDAPISEAGWETEKFDKTRALFAKYLQPGEALPEVPAKNPVIAIPEFNFKPFAKISNTAVAENHARNEPLTFEALSLGRGCMEYTRILPPGPAGKLSLGEVHDYAWVELDGKLIATLDRRSKRYSVSLPARAKEAGLTIIVEGVGRVNFGKEVADHKGILGPVTFAAGADPVEKLTNTPGFTNLWISNPAPLEETDIVNLSKAYGPNWTSNLPMDAAHVFWRGSFEVEKPGDTFLDLRTWGHGVVWVNGHCLGRFWNIGPTQTMYLPGPWMKAGKNEVIVLDLLAPRNPTMSGLTQPILNELHPELDWATHVRATGTFTTEGLAPAAQGSFTQDVQRQDARFAAPAKGRYLCLESLNTFDNRGVSAVAELDAFGPDGKDLPKSNWKVLWATSEELTSEDGAAEHALDGQSATHWHTAYSKETSPFPHRLVVDLGEETTLGGIRYLPRAGETGKPARIRDYRVYVSDQPFGLTPLQ